jgi:hypothetical protein
MSLWTGESLGHTCRTTQRWRRRLWQALHGCTCSLRSRSGRSHICQYFGRACSCSFLRSQPSQSIKTATHLAPLGVGMVPLVGHRADWRPEGLPLWILIAGYTETRSRARCRSGLDGASPVSTQPRHRFHQAVPAAVNIKAPGRRGLGSAGTRSSGSRSGDETDSNAGSVLAAHNENAPRNRDLASLGARAMHGGSRRAGVVQIIGEIKRRRARLSSSRVAGLGQGSAMHGGRRIV